MLRKIVRRKALINIDYHYSLYKQILEMNRLSFGEFAMPGEDRLIARYKFLISIREIAPEVFADLKVFVDRYSRLMPVLSEFSRENKKQWFTFQDLDNITHDVEMAVEFKSNLVEWAIKWNIKEDWFLFTAFHIIISWYINPEIMVDLIVHPSEHQEYFNRRNKELKKIGQHPEFPIAPPKPYNPAAVSKKEYFEEHNNYIDTIDKIFLDNGWLDTKNKRNRGGGIQKHFDWVVKYQIKNMSYKEIAQEYADSDPNGEIDISDKGVKIAVVRTAEDIGIGLRKRKKKGT